MVYSKGHKHVTDVNLDLTVVFLNRTLLMIVCMSVHADYYGIYGHNIILH